jgi:hypothetical protein
MKLTLLELVQDMLTAIESENVSDVGETEEAGMCVNIANRAFEDMAAKHRWKHMKQYGRLNTTANLNEMSAPSGTVAIDYANMWYEGNPVYYVEPDEFVRMTINREGTNTEIINMIPVYNDRNPVYWTSDDDQTIRFDAIPDSTNGLVSTNTFCIIWKTPTSRLSSNSEYFDMPAQAYPALRSLMLAYAVGELKGDTSQAGKYNRDHTKMMGSLARNARFVERPTDIRKNIVARRSRRFVAPIISEA